MQDRATVPGGGLGLGSRLADALDGGQQQVMGGGGAGAWSGPERFEQGKDPGLPGGDSARTGQTELHGGGDQREGAVRFLTKAATRSAGPR
jgi:hypothetical protein